MEITERYEDDGLDIWNNVATSQSMLEPREAKRGRNGSLKPLVGVWLC